MLRFKSAGAFPFGQMAKRKPVGVSFRFPVSFRAIVWGVGLLGSGTGNCIAFGCVSLVACLGFWYVCKGVGVEGKYKTGKHG